MLLKGNMTSINEKIFQLDDPNYINYDRRKQDYLRIAPTTGTANNLNQGGNIISFESNNHANFFIYPEALFITNSTLPIKMVLMSLEISL